MPAEPAVSGDDRSALLNAFRIDAEDLEANRGGRLGPRQLGRLTRAAGWRLLGAAAIVAAALLVVMLVRPPPALDVLLGGLVLAGLGWALLVAAGLRGTRREEAVACLSGPVQLMLLFREHRGWWLTVEGRSFPLPVPPDVLDDGAPYRVYYLRAAHRVVAIEPAPDLTRGLRSVLPQAG